MVVEENWAIDARRISDFFRSQPDVVAENNGFRFGRCRITLTPLEGRIMGRWPLHRTSVRMEGPEDEVKAIHRRFFLQFLSAGG